MDDTDLNKKREFFAQFKTKKVRLEIIKNRGIDKITGEPVIVRLFYKGVLIDVFDDSLSIDDRVLGAVLIRFEDIAEFSQLKEDAHHG